MLESIKFLGFVLLAYTTAWTWEVYIAKDDLRFLRSSIFAGFCTVYALGMLIAGR